MSDLLSRAEAWRRGDPDPDTAAEIDALLKKNDLIELARRFAGDIGFGTAGLRGIIGAGPARMNRAVVRRAMAGLARFLVVKESDNARRGVVIGRDARLKSDVFASEAAGVLNAVGVITFVFPQSVPTPLVAFAVTHLGASAGVMITASHNPAEYNGLKIYGVDGAQVAAPEDEGIAARIAQTGPANEIPTLVSEEARERGLLRDVDEHVGKAYLNALSGLVVHPGEGRDLRLVLTPLHGVGGRWLETALASEGFVDRHVVRAQQAPDGAFPTVRYPNPEEPGALDLALALADERHADLVLAIDPDADRLAVAARDDDGKLRTLSGNDVGVLLGHHVLEHGIRRVPRPLVITSIVSSPALGRIARDLGAEYEETLTGFKWIARRAMQLELGGATFLFGYEEALGYCMGRIERDKDGIGAALALADLAGACRARGHSLWHRLEDIQRRHGLFVSKQVNRWMNVDGRKQTRRLLQKIREEPPPSFAACRVMAVRDYAERIQRRGETTTPLDLPSADVVAFECDDGERITIRPSGTEPKMKFYFDVGETIREGESVAAARERGEERLARIARDFMQFIDNI